MGRSDGKRNPSPAGPNRKQFVPICVWCGAVFYSSRRDARTCGPSHRSALARYKRKHGAPPSLPFGVDRAQAVEQEENGR